MDNARVWSVICLALMIATVFLEMLTPSMGGFTVVALAIAGASIYLGFQDSPSFGYLMVFANLVSFPLSLWLGIGFLKRSPLIHRSEMSGGSQNAPDALPLDRLLGKEGRAITPLRPGGSALIGEEKVDVVSEGKFVERDTAIKVIRVDGSRVVVEPSEAK